ncbi:MAG: hypothetical protein AAF975_02825 [Spirochaetota bacterium]
MNLEKKKRIVQEALQRISEDDGSQTILVDAGSTCFELLKLLETKPDLTIVTPSLAVSELMVSHLTTAEPEVDECGVTLTPVTYGARGFQAVGHLFVSLKIPLLPRHRPLGLLWAVYKVLRRAKRALQVQCQNSSIPLF